MVNGCRWPVHWSERKMLIWCRPSNIGASRSTVSIHMHNAHKKSYKIRRNKILFYCDLSVCLHQFVPVGEWDGAQLSCQMCKMIRMENIVNEMCTTAYYILISIYFLVFEQCTPLRAHTHTIHSSLSFAEKRFTLQVDDWRCVGVVCNRACACKLVCVCARALTRFVKISFFQFLSFGW